MAAFPSALASWLCVPAFQPVCPFPAGRYGGFLSLFCRKRPSRPALTLLYHGTVTFWVIF
ncbi:hypothetical protein BACCAP_00641 [Pseudoflavonifractor capillosus ATCC 29799]|uniref:Uncharacterized protein n=1 Tax=Pseudoflavonifractor capillosus ATCC 29799 TaxID=411467 RepID=A6NR17_9FIRM|nr:hypothetical protein BACCAP_00641 [Pseudoflavonifractor capillosus ATCC 29799]